MNDPTKRLVQLANALRDVSQGVSSGLHEPDASVLRRETRLHDVATRLHASVQDARGDDEHERRRAQERLVAATLPRLEKRASALRRAVEQHLADSEDEAELSPEFPEYEAGARAALQAIDDALEALRVEVGPLAMSAAPAWRAEAASAEATPADAALADAAPADAAPAKSKTAGAAPEPARAASAGDDGATVGTDPRETGERGADRGDAADAEGRRDSDAMLTPETIANAIALGIRTALAQMLPQLQAAFPAPAPAAREISAVTLPGMPETELWRAVTYHSEQTQYGRFAAFVDAVFTGGAHGQNGGASGGEHRRGRTAPPGDPYRLLNAAADAFLLTHSASLSPEAEAGPRAQWTAATPDAGLASATARSSVEPLPVDVGDLRARLAAFMGDTPHLDAIVRALGGARRALSPFSPVAAPDPGFASLLELFWSYWHEEGMLAQTLIALALRFQGVRRGTRDPLAELASDPLRPLSRVLWGFIEDEPNRLSVARRAYEYHHEYGLALVGRAVPRLPASDAGARFLSAFHNVLRRASEFLGRSDAGAAADAFALLNALVELHALLAEGSVRPYRDVPWTARREMLVQQWILARPEVHEFLRARAAPPQAEPWMGAVDAMRRVQRWGGASALHFRDLAVLGERLLLSVRHHPWPTTTSPELARAWALHFRPAVRGYVDAYRAATGVDITAGPQADDTPPSALLQRRFAAGPARR
ncbi:MAG: hypothetical protein ACJ8AO_12945 [Gemmatimonadaceae bacterium]